MKPALILSAAAIPAAVIISEAASWWWMNPPRPEEAVAAPAYRFPIERPDTRLDEEKLPSIKKTLSCDEGTQGLIRTSSGAVISVAFFEWNRSENARVTEVLGHLPEVCMGARGADLLERYPARQASFDGFHLIFDTTRFRGGNDQPLFIFKASWIEGFDAIDLRQGPFGHSAQEEARRFRIAAAKNRFKSRYARILMGGVYGVQTEEQAWEHFEREVLRDVSVNHLVGK